MLFNLKFSLIAIKCNFSHITSFLIYFFIIINESLCILEGPLIYDFLEEITNCHIHLVYGDTDTMQSWNFVPVASEKLQYPPYSTAVVSSKYSSLFSLYSYRSVSPRFSILKSKGHECRLIVLYIPHSFYEGGSAAFVLSRNANYSATPQLIGVKEWSWLHSKELQPIDTFLLWMLQSLHFQLVKLVGSFQYCSILRLRFWEATRIPTYASQEKETLQRCHWQSVILWGDLNCLTFHFTTHTPHPHFSSVVHLSWEVLTNFNAKRLAVTNPFAIKSYNLYLAAQIAVKANTTISWNFHRIKCLQLNWTYTVSTTRFSLISITSITLIFIGFWGTSKGGTYTFGNTYCKNWVHFTFINGWNN